MGGRKRNDEPRPGLCAFCGYSNGCFRNKHETGETGKLMLVL